MKRFKKSILCILMTVAAAFCLCFGAGCDEEEFSYEGGESNTEYVQIYNLNASNTPVQMAIVGGRFTFRAPTRDGLVFVGLFDAAGLEIVDAQGNCKIEVQNGLQLYARWEKMECTLYFNAGEDGTLDEDERSQTLDYESDLYSFPVPTPVVGKVFVCWLNGDTPVTDENGDLLENKGKLTSESFTFTEGSKVNFTAKYDVQKFTYTFDYQDEDYENKTGVVEYGATFATIKTEFPELVDTGSRELIGWSLNSFAMEEITESEVIADDITLYAIWRDYKIFYFFEDEGVAATPVKIYQGNNDLYQPKQKNGYEFIGWYTNNYFGGSAVQSINYYSSVETYWARWEMETYTLTFESNGGGSFDSVRYTIEDYKQLPTPQKENFTFVGWCMEEDLSDTPRTVITVGSFGGGVMYAKYKGIDRTAKLQTNGGTLAQAQATVEYGAKYTLAVPTYEGFAFAGWFDGDGDDAEKLTDSKGVSYGKWDYLEEETTLYAKYTKKYYIHIEYRDKDNLSTSVGATAQVEEYYVSGEPATFTVTVEEGYRYDGIYANNNLAVEPITREKEYTFNMPASDCTFFIKVYPETYTLTFELSGGTMEDKDSVVITYGKEFTLPVPYKKAHVFKGWLYNDELCTDEYGESISTTQIKANGKLTAKFEINPAFENYTEITTVEEFMAISQNPGGVYVLGKSINLSGRAWTACDFTGSLDGSGFTVSGLRTNLFNVVTGTVKNLKLDVNVSVTNTGNCQQIGGFAKVVNGNALIENITVYGSISTEGNYDCGGVIGGSSSGSPIIRNCKNYATVTSVNNEHYTGGVIGALHVIGAEIYGCENYGAVSSKNAAGVCAWIKSAMTFKECINAGNVSGTALAGGIVSYLGGTATINACGSYGEVLLNGVAGGKYAAGTNVSYVNLKPIYIKEASELVWLSNCITQEVFVLENDIDMSGVNWTPFNFGATLDGAGHKIKNFTLSTDSGDVGFFATLTGTVKNLKFENVNVETTSDANVSVGVLAGIVGNNGRVQKVEVLSGSVKGVMANVGGIVGTMNGNGLIEGCKNYASVSTTGATDATGTAGGILGYITSGVIRDCENFGTVSGQYRVGGVIGCTWIAGTCAFNNLINHAPITGTNNFVGGVIGRWGAAQNLEVIATMKNEGAVSGANYVGGVIGQVHNNLSSNADYATTLRGYTNSGAVSGTEYVGGVFGQVYANNSYSGSRHMYLYASEMKNTGNATGVKFVGGVAGHIYSDTAGSTFSGVSSARVVAEQRVGGIVGVADYVALVDCSNAGSSVTATKYETDNNGTTFAYLGGYAGVAHRVANCQNAVEISYELGGRYVGGIVGIGYRDLENCSNTADVYAPNSSYVGGVVGGISYGWSITYNKISNSGNITGKDRVGGVFGELYNVFSSNGDYVSTGTALTNSGNIVASGDYAGGIFGYFDATNTYSSSRILKFVGTEWKNTGNVSGKTYVGGFIGYGYTDTDGSYVSGTSSGTITAEARVGGLAGTLNGVQLVDCFNTGSKIIATKYATDSNGNYYAYVGGYAGEGHGFVNCHNASEIIYTQDGNYVGGIAGYADYVVENCSNTAEVTAPKSTYVGGLVGRTSYGWSLTYSTLTNSGNITGKERVGGVFGELYNVFSSDGDYTSNGTAFENSGNIVASGENAGGIIGRLEMKNTYSSSRILKFVATEWKNTGNVSGKTYVGGFVGYGSTDTDGSYISGSSSGKITAEARVGGLGGWLDAIRLVDCSNQGAQIVATKYILDNNGNYFAYVGGYAGKGHGFVNCHNASEIIYTQDGNYVGGIAGYADYVVENCSNTAEITAPKSTYVGGVVGRTSYGWSLTYSTLTNSGNITGKTHVGGVFGELYNVFSSNGDYTSNGTAFENSGNIVASGENAGGIIGHLEMNNTYNASRILKFVGTEWKNTGNVSGKIYVGGFIGYGSTDTGSSYVSGTSSGTIKAEARVGGLAGWLNDIRLVDCSNKGSQILATKYFLDTGNSTYYAHVGGYAGKGDGFINCHNEANIVYENKGIYVGGIAGYADDVLENCSNKGTITAVSSDYVGGLVGYSRHGSYSFTYSNLSNSGAVSGKAYVGGLFGETYQYAEAKSYYTITLQQLSNSGAITGAGDFVGGLFGRIQSTNYYGGYNIISATECSNTGAVSTSGTYVGGLFGHAYAQNTSSKILTSSSSGAVSGKALVGGLVGCIENIVLQDCSNKGASVVATGYVLENTTNKCVYLGGFAGKGYGFSDCTNEINLSYTGADNGWYIGGIVGYACSALAECSNQGNINAPNAIYVGGLAGKGVYNGAITLTGLTNAGSVLGYAYVGGLYGELFGEIKANGDYQWQLSSLKNTGTVAGTGNAVGGLAGRLYIQNTYGSKIMKATMSVFENSGTISGSVTDYTGAFFGEFWSDGASTLMDATYNLGNVNSGRLIGTQTGLTIA